MCGRFVQVLTIETLKTGYGIEATQDEITDSYNVAPGDYAYVISSNVPNKLQRYQFGLTPNWAKKPMYLFNARAEGDLNKENDPDFKGDMGIVDKPSFKKPIRSQRCIILANAFYEGPEKEKLNQPYLISNKNGELMSFAGIWDTWVHPDTKEETHSFAIITTAANSMTKVIGHPRCPAIIPSGLEKRWLNPELELAQVLAFLKPYPGEEMKAVPVSVQIKDPKNKRQEISIPVGDTLTSESAPVVVKKDLKLQGMGTRKKKKDPPGWQRTLFD